MIIDISRDQKGIQFSEAKLAGVSGVIAKASQGTYDSDQFFYKACLQSIEVWGEVFGAYHLLTLENSSAQYSIFNTCLRPYISRIKNICVDFESVGGSDLETNWDKAMAVLTNFTSHVRHYGKPIYLYADRSNWQRLSVERGLQLSDYKRWIASPGERPDMSYDLWQLTGDAGYSGWQASGTDINLEPGDPTPTWL